MERSTTILRDSIPLFTTGSCLMGGVPRGYFHGAPPPTRSHYCPDTKTPRSLYHSSRRKNDVLHISNAGADRKRREIILPVFLRVSVRVGCSKSEQLRDDNIFRRPLNDVVYQLLRKRVPKKKWRIILVRGSNAILGSVKRFVDICF